MVLYPAAALTGGAIALYSLVPRDRASAPGATGRGRAAMALALSGGALLLLLQWAGFADMASNISRGGLAYRAGAVTAVAPVAVELVVLTLVVVAAHRRVASVARTIWIAVAANLLVTFSWGVY